jgi:gas vesicle protein GvpO
MAQRGEAQRERASARERRRSLMSKPFEALDDAANGDGEGAAAAAKTAARTAAAAALAGGLAGAAKALVERRTRYDDDDENEDEAAEADEPQADERPRPTAEAESADQADDADPEDEAEGGESGEDADDDEEPQPAAKKRSSDQRDGDEPQQGASSSEASGIVDQARDYVADVLGKDAESVSGISRANGSWTVTVEVVDVHRIPESTDVLSSYEVVVDDDGGLLSLERRGRYRRSQVEEDR